jgi:hypothetical protein
MLSRIFHSAQNRVQISLVEWFIMYICHGYKEKPM